MSSPPVNKRGKMCDASAECCEQLEAEAIHSNEQLLAFDIRSKQIKWHDRVITLQSRALPVYLQRQYKLISSYREPIGDHNRRQVLLCHDMMGNYLEDRHYHSSKKFDDYRFYHWSGVDYFCYFSHKYITIPPCGWINAAHRHGVRVLGTFITEGASGSKLLREVLQSKEMINRIVTSMVKLCKHYIFEGWLVNIECKVDPEDMENMNYFLERLHTLTQREVEYGLVFWYDSIIQTGELAWQNEVNANNVCFFRLADAMLINYSWNNRSLEVTQETCRREQIPFLRAFFGLDVFGRSQIAKFQSKQTLARIVNKRFSTGIFAPGWTYETLTRFGFDIKDPLGRDDVNEAFLRRNDKFWCSLWEHLATHPYNQLPFYSDFCLGSGKNTYECGVIKKQLPVANDGPSTSAASLSVPCVSGPSTSAAASTSNVCSLTTTTPNSETDERFFNLTRQAMQPSVPLHEVAERYYDDAFNGGSCLKILQHDSSFRIFVTDFAIKRSGLVCAYAYKLAPDDGELDVIVRFCANNNARDCYLFLGDYYNTISTQRGRCYVSPFKPQYNHLLRGMLETSHIPKDMAFESMKANGWGVRYYVVAFDGFMHVKDIGVLYRKSVTALDTAYLGALYMTEFDPNAFNFPMESNIALIQVFGNDLLS